MSLRVFLLIVIASVICSAIWEARRWQTGLKTMTTKQKWLRITSVSLLVIILAMIAVGDCWLKKHGPLAVLSYWSACLGLTGILAVLALLDIREIGLAYMYSKKQITDNLLQSSNETNDEK